MAPSQPVNESSGERKCCSCEEDSPCEEKCGCEDENDSGNEDPGVSEKPVQYSTGIIKMTETDVAARVPSFTHGRVWRNRISGNGRYDGPNGFNWDVQEWPYLIQRSTSGGKITINCRIGSLQLRFDKVGSNYVARHSKSDRYTLTHDAGANLFALTRKTNGGVETIQFQDFTQTTNPVGLMWQRTTPQGFVTQVTSYTANGNINALTTTRGTPGSGSGGAVFELAYSYHGSGSHLNKIEHVTLNELDQFPNPTTTTPLRRCRYEYHDGTNDEGSLNDLKAAIIQKPAPAPGSGWTDIEVCYYRYYVSTGNDSQGNPIVEAGGYLHGLKYVLGPAAYAELKEAGQDALLGPAGYPAGGDLFPGYADNYFEYGQSQRVVKEVARGCSACGSSGGTGNTGETFTRATNPNYPGMGAPSSDYLYNTWKTKTVSQDHPGHETIVYTNRVNRVMLKVKRELNTGGALRQWCTYYEYDDNGREILKAEPSAVRNFDENKPDLVGKQGLGDYMYLKPSGGLIHETTYYASTTATATTPGGVEGYEESTGIREGTQGTLIKTGLTTYLASDNGGSGGEVTYAVAERTTYPDTTNQDATKIVTSHTYQWYPPTSGLPVRMKERVTTLPAISGGQNGDGTSATRREFFDESGNLTYQMDERGIVDQMVYEPTRDQMTQKIEDVASVPPAVGWSVTPGNHFGYETDYEYDQLGRPTLMLGPSHDAEISASQTVRTYRDMLHLESAIADQALGDPLVGNQVRSAPGYATGSPGSYTYNLVDPVGITFSDKLGRTLDQVQSKRSTGSGLLAESDTFLRADWSRWSVMHYTKKGQLAYQRDYFDIPAQSPDQGLGGIHETPGTPTPGSGEGGNYNETFHGYDPETNLRVRTKSPNGTITRTVYDKIDRPVQTYVGTDDVPEPIGGMIGQWPLDEGTGTTAHDTSDTDNNGTLNNAVWSSDTPPTTPSLSHSLSFNGTDANVSVPDVAAYSVGGRLTVAAWVKGTPGAERSISGQYDYGNNQRAWQCLSGNNDATKLRVILSDNGQYNATHAKNWESSLTCFDGDWHHVAFTFETGQLKLFVDGVEDLAPSKLFDASFSSLHNSTAQLTIGSVLQNGNSVGWFDGNIADVRFYDRALSPVEVAELAAVAGANDLWERWSPTPGTPGNSGTNLVLVSEVEYDDGQPGGNSNVTKSTAVVDANTCRETRYTYDFRDRKLIDDGEETLYAVTTYDNLNRVTQVDQRDTTAMGHLIARQLSFYDDRSRVYRTQTPEVDPTTGTVGSGLLEGNRFYDPAGNVLKSIAPGDGVKATYQTFDNLGRTTLTEVGYDDAGATNGRLIAESNATTYDAASHAIASTLNQLDTGATPTTQTYRVSYSFAWFDGIGRQISSANYGALGSAPTREATTPNREDTVLVTEMQYNDRGEQFATIDPMEREVRTTFDDLGRPRKVIENYSGGGVPASPGSDDNRTTETTYTPDSQVRTLTAVMSATGTTNQVTTYVYGTPESIPGNSSGLVSNDLLVETIYPDGAPGIDSVRLVYNRQGQVTQRIDQAGTTHDYHYDGLGRLRHDCVVAFGSGIHEHVRRLTTEYEVRGMPAVYSSASTATPNPSGSGGSVINQVKLEYNGFGQLVNDYQSHAGAVVSSTTPWVAHDYESPTGTSNRIRLTEARYPNGDIVNLAYGAPTSISDNLNRVDTLTADAVSIDALYAYLGQSDTTRTTLEDDVDTIQLDHWGGIVGTYTGLDRFSRITDHPWTNESTSTTLSQFQYGYDRNSNRLYRADLEAQSQSKDFDELYTYDSLDRLDLMKRGLLNTAKNGIQSGTLGFEQDWDLDPVGNWATFEQDSTGAGSFDLTQERQHNRVNEITDISEQPSEPQWLTPAYDPAGNTTTFPQGGSGGDPSKGFTAKYDAWNRLCKVTDPAIGSFGGTVAEYEYDARGFRIRRREYDPATGAYQKCYDDYFNRRWQLLETRVTTSTTAVATDVYEQYVWHASADAYIDQLLLRRRDTSLAGGGTPGTLNETFIALQDAHYNIAAIADTNGVVQERYAYGSYGKREIFDASFGLRSSPSYQWAFGHQGLAHDGETGLIYNRLRYLHTLLGRFISRDPVGYADGLLAYEYVRGRPNYFTDKFGLITGSELALAAGGAAAIDGPLPFGDIVATGLLVGAAAVVINDAIGQPPGSKPLPGFPPSFPPGTGPLNPPVPPPPGGPVPPGAIGPVPKPIPHLPLPPIPIPNFAQSIIDGVLETLQDWLGDQLQYGNPKCINPCPPTKTRNHVSGLAGSASNDDFEICSLKGVVVTPTNPKICLGSYHCPCGDKYTVPCGLPLPNKLSKDDISPGHDHYVNY